MDNISRSGQTVSFCLEGVLPALQSVPTHPFLGVQHLRPSAPPSADVPICSDTLHPGQWPVLCPKPGQSI